MIFGLLKAGYSKVKAALTKTQTVLMSKLRDIFQGKIDADALERLEQLFYEADLGVKTASQLANKMRQLFDKNRSLTFEEAVAGIQQELFGLLNTRSAALVEPPVGSPLVILVVGVNGNGKTTSIAKLAKRFKEQGKKPLLAAADTFRAAAVEQLEIWASRIGVDIVKGASRGDPAAVVFDAIAAAKARGADVVLIDTAGRLQTKTDLMHELAKIRRVAEKACPGAPHETLLVLDATTGQNAVDQAMTFHSFTPMTGLVLTKLDGTAKGGIVVAIQQQLNIPVKFIGVGEGLDDLLPFDPEGFVKSLLG